jgi:hypothetical protein
MQCGIMPGIAGLWQFKLGKAQLRPGLIVNQPDL